MTLRARLSLVVLVVLMLPLAAGALILVSTVPDAIRDQLTGRLENARAAVDAVLAERCARAGAAARSLGLEAATAGPDTAVREALRQRSVDYAALLTADGQVVARGGDLPADVDVTGGSSCSRMSAGPGEQVHQPGLVETVDVRSAEQPEVRTAVVVSRVDPTVVRGLVDSLGLDGGLTVASGGRVLASTLDPNTAARLVSAAGPRRENIETSKLLGAVAFPRAGQPFTVVVTSQKGSADWLTGALGGVAAGALGLAVVLVWVLARELTRPLAELTSGAERVARGDLDASIPVRSGDEVGRMALAFNDMTKRIKEQLDELARGRDALRANLDRVGDALARTHDLDGIVSVVLATAMSAVGATAGAVYLERGGSLRLSAARDQTAGRFAGALGQSAPGGVLSRVLASGESLRSTTGQLGISPGAEDAGGSAALLAAPVRRGGAVVGVLVLYGQQDGREFNEGDQETIRTLVTQAGVAIENVLLHEEAQRLSITDPLTGLWNYRYLSMSLERELDRAARFSRHVAVLMLDLDHFKAVNDAYGHQRGDAVLRDLTRRVAEQIRDVDTFARYGGEEFALVLPETDADGAALVADRVCSAVRRVPFGVAGEARLTLTVSVGVALFPLDGTDPATLLRAADDALYAAKGAGRDRWRMSSDPDQRLAGSGPPSSG